MKAYESKVKMERILVLSRVLEIHTRAKASHNRAQPHTTPSENSNTEVPCREESFHMDSKQLACLLSNSVKGIPERAWVFFFFFKHKWLLGANAAGASLSSELTPTQYQKVIKPPLTWRRTAGWGEPGMCVDMLSNSLLNPQLWTASHSDWARKMSNKKRRKGLGHPSHRRLLPSAKWFQRFATCPMDQHMLLRR